MGMNSEQLHTKEDSQKTEQEKPLRLDRLVRQGEWERLNESKEFREMSVEGRILTTGNAVTNRIKTLEDFFAHALAKRPDQSAVILGKMRYLRNVQDALDGVLVDHIQGEQKVNGQDNIIDLAQRRMQQTAKKAA